MRHIDLYKRGSYWALKEAFRHPRLLNLIAQRDRMAFSIWRILNEAII